jgi:DNA-binding transcriptional ArsR family regulator
MEMKNAVPVLSALAHEGRLSIFRALVQAGPEGLAAGVLGQAVGSPASTLSNNLTILGHAGLVASRRDGRSIIYAADYGRMSALLSFLVEDCCKGSSGVCEPSLAEVAAKIACA